MSSLKIRLTRIAIIFLITFLVSTGYITEPKLIQKTNFKKEIVIPVRKIDPRCKGTDIPVYATKMYVVLSEYGSIVITISDDIENLDQWSMRSDIKRLNEILEIFSRIKSPDLFHKYHALVLWEVTAYRDAAEAMLEEKPSLYRAKINEARSMSKLVDLELKNIKKGCGY